MTADREEWNMNTCCGGLTSLGIRQGDCDDLTALLYLLLMYPQADLTVFY